MPPPPVFYFPAQRIGALSVPPNLGSGKVSLRIVYCNNSFLTVGVSGISTVTSYKAMINTVLGGETAQAGSAEAYAFTSDYDSTTEMLTARKAVAEQLSEEGSVEPELYIHVDGDVDGMGAADGGSMNVRVLSGALTVHNEKHAYSGINFGVNGDRVYVAEGAAINVVNFGADYGVWNITEYYFHIEGTLNSYGSDNAAGSVGNAASPISRVPV